MRYFIFCTVTFIRLMAKFKKLILAFTLVNIEEIVKNSKYETRSHYSNAKTTCCIKNILINFKKHINMNSVTYKYVTEFSSSAKSNLFYN